MAKANVQGYVSSPHFRNKTDYPAEKIFSRLGFLGIVMAQVYAIKWTVVPNFKRS